MKKCINFDKCKSYTRNNMAKYCVGCSVKRMIENDSRRKLNKYYERKMI